MKTKKIGLKVDELTSRLVDYFIKSAYDLIDAKLDEDYEKCKELLEDIHSRIIILSNLMVNKNLVKKELHEVVFDFIEIYEVTQLSLEESEYNLHESLKVRIGSYGFLY